MFSFFLFISNVCDNKSDNFCSWSIDTYGKMYALSWRKTGNTYTYIQITIVEILLLRYFTIRDTNAHKPGSEIKIVRDCQFNGTPIAITDRYLISDHLCIHLSWMLWLIVCSVFVYEYTGNNSAIYFPLNQKFKILYYLF